MALKRIVAPTLEVVPLDDMKAHLHVSHDDEDAYITALTKAAVRYLDGREGVLGWCLGAQTWELTYDAFPNGPIQLPIGPLLSVVSVTADGVAVGSDEYEIDAANNPGWLVPLNGWPAVNSVNGARIVFVAGHTSAADIHESVGMIVRLLVGNWYRNREATTPAAQSVLPMAADMLLSAIRWRGV